MKLNKLLSLVLSALIVVLGLSVAFPVFAAETVEDGVVIVEEKCDKTNRYTYYPEELKSNKNKYSVIIWANGTGMRQSVYKSLLKAIAAEGFVVVSSDVTMAADGKDQSAGLDYIIGKSKTKGNVLYNRISIDKVTAMGHSQGGRSAVNAACSDNRFCCVVSIAGSNYKEEAELLTAPTLFLTGTADTMVDSATWVKPAYDVCKGAAVYASLIGANHLACYKTPEKYVSYCTSWIKAWTDENDSELSVFKSKGALVKDTAWTDVTSKNLTNNISGSVTLSSSEFVYNGKVKKPSVKVTNYRGAVITSDNYTVSYDEKGCKNVGKYKVTVKYKNKYSGKKSVYFTILPKNTSIKKVTAKKAGFKVTWSKKTTETTGYQLQFSTSSKFSKPTSVTISDCKKSSYTAQKLKKGKKYYVRIRTYKTVGKSKYYSAWSTAETVTTKK